ncbi:uncharacterized protein KQ657_004605 [Scheffersomyces spartinae]|uniref:DUF1776-domain-containing protein n=1 Tax=Scheffersomyces spartinae TaxID=45513 RepID=A0A9P7VAQ3_9ASCO|nr:uncharacterized protein KQ657_004605 [Scheffersomyces spartinae]KAG7194392.1 hypothetical protein KQ657_004605 [Scheffersomyces spartinae]
MGEQYLEAFDSQRASNLMSTSQEAILNFSYTDTLSEINPWGKDDLELTNTDLKTRNFWCHWSNLSTRDKRICSGVCAVGISIVGGIWYRHMSQVQPKSKRFKRRVPKLANGARRDVVLVVGSPVEPLTRLIALDFEKRGFIVYMSILDGKDQRYVELNPITDDINYLNLMSDVNGFKMQIEKFQQLLNLPVIPFPGAEPHTLRLVSIVFAPTMFFPIGPIENISVTSWQKMSDRLMVFFKLLSSGLVGLARDQNSKLILIYNSIISSTDLPYHGPEVVFQNSLKNLFTVLTREVYLQGISVTQVRLGNLHSSSTENQRNKVANMVSSELRDWSDDMRSLYGNQFSRVLLKTAPVNPKQGIKLREFYHLLFDLTYSNRRNPTYVYCGSGARTYDIITSIVPNSLLNRFL